jgi:energy-coupling factor transport system permease protein
VKFVSISPVLLAQLRLLATPLLVLAAFTLPVVALPVIAAVLIGAILRRPSGVTQLRRLLPVVAIQLVIVGTVYGVRSGIAAWPTVLTICGRLALAFLPGIWFFITTPSHAVVAALRPWVSPRLALLISLSLAQLPRVLRSMRRIYSVQRLRGARIRPHDFWRPSAWRDLVLTVLVPLLVQLIRDCRQLEVALGARGYDDTIRPTVWSLQP